MAGFFRQYSWILDLVGVLFCSFFLARITGVYVGKALEVKRSIGVLTAAEVQPLERQKRQIADYDIIIKRNIFDPTEKTETPPEEAGEETAEQTVVTGEAVKTSLNITVLGVLVVGDGTDKRSSATIAGGGGGGGGDKKGAAAASTGANVYAVGDKESFAPNTVLLRVKPDRIEFSNNGRLEYAELASDFGQNIFGPPQVETVAAAEVPEAKKGDALVSQDGSKFTVDQREVDDALQNLDRLYTDIRAVPNFAGGKVSGMKILSVKNGSLFSKLGLKRGDVLQKINGMELDVKQGFAIFNQLKDEKHISLDLIRQGNPTTLDYDIR
jgi:general secretion pathway protein C